MKNHFKKFGRRYTQVIAALLLNCHITGFATGKIYQGNAKLVCAPGLNCYSCPGAVLSCPLGSLQNALAQSKMRFPYYVLGTIILFGVLAGRFICGFLCPFGFFQELLYKIPVPKLKKNRFTNILKYLKYVILALFVVAVPLIKAAPGFCKYICPAGTLEGAIPLIALNASLQNNLGFLFSWKVIVLLIIIVLSLFCYRFFCRFICPLGAIYSLFAGKSVFRMQVDEDKCSGCGKCTRECLMDVKKVGDGECICCMKCTHECPNKAIRFKA